MENKFKKQFLKSRQLRKEKKNIENKDITGEEVIFIFEKVLEGWKTITIYNTIIQTNPNSKVNKKRTEQVATGNCKVYPSELPIERYNYYVELRKKVYELTNQNTIK